MFSDDAFRKIEKPPIKEIPLVSSKNMIFIDRDVFRSTNEIYYDLHFSRENFKFNPIDDIDDKISLDRMTYAEWNRMMVLFMRALGASMLTLEFALDIANYLKNANVSIQNIQDAIIMGEQTTELDGVIGLLNEYLSKPEQR